jgi:endonuclease YncB( thermonuclease family)
MRFLLLTMIAQFACSFPAAASESVKGEAEIRDAVTIVIDGARYTLADIVEPQEKTCGNRPCGEAAIQLIGPRLAGRQTTCLKERRLGHGRFLARCKLENGTDLATVILEEGLALPESNAPPGYISAAQKAKLEGRGVWSH